MKAVLLGAAIAASLYAQGARSTFTTTRGTQAAEVFGGVTYGHGDSTTDPHVITRIRGGISRYLSGYFDWSYSRPVDESSGGFAERRSLMFFMPGVQVHAPLGRVEPYIIGGLGAARDRGTYRVGTFSGGYEDNRFAQSAGAGVRIYATRHVGFTFEARGVHVNGAGWWSMYSVGLLGQFGGSR